MRRIEGAAVKPYHFAALTAFVGLSVALGLALQPYRRNKQSYNCQSNLRYVRNAWFQYIRDYDEKTPLARNWNSLLRPYWGFPKMKSEAVNRVFDCPLPGTGYALNRFYANGLSYTRAEPAPTSVMIFDSTLETPNASDFGQSWPRQSVHQSGRTWGNNVLFVDGHVELLAQKPVFRAFTAQKATR